MANEKRLTFDTDKTCGDCIHADICKKVNGSWFSPKNIAYCEAYKDSTNYVEVVRCKDCKWYERDTDYAVDVTTGKRDFNKIVEKPYGECQGQNFHFTEDGFLRVGDNDFCSYGERREGE